jgi:hypothetical protein
MSSTLERFDDLGDTPQGHRLLAVIGQGEGSINGDRIRGTVLQGSGGDWLRLRPDGAGQLNVHFTFETDDGALIYMRYEGIAAGGAIPRVLGGENVPPSDYYFRTTPYFETSAPQYAWLNQIVAIGVGQLDLANSWAGYEVYEVL